MRLSVKDKNGDHLSGATVYYFWDGNRAEITIGDYDPDISVPPGVSEVKFEGHYPNASKIVRRALATDNQCVIQFKDIEAPSRERQEIHMRRPGPPAGPAHVTAGNPVLLVISIAATIFGCYAIYAGIQLMNAPGSGETVFEFIGLHFTTKQAGVASIGLGAAVLILSFRQVLKTLRHLAGL